MPVCSVLPSPSIFPAEALEEKLQGDAFKPCGPQETTRQGWVPPLGKHSDMLVHSTNGYHLIALRKEDKILPGSVVKEIVEERAEAIEIEQSRKVRRKEKDEIKEQVMLEMLPQAFSQNRRSFAYLAPQDGLLVVDAGSSKQAEDLASFLRKSLGSLPVRPPAVEQAPAFTFTGWLNESIDLPGTIELGTECELKRPVRRRWRGALQRAGPESGRDPQPPGRRHAGHQAVPDLGRQPVVRAG